MAEEELKENLTLAQRAIATLTWMITSIDYQNASLVDYDQGGNKFSDPQPDSDEMKEARLLLEDLTSANDILDEAIQVAMRKSGTPGYTIAPTDCHECMKDDTPVCPYWSGGCKRPNPNPCPQHEPIPLANCPCCKGYRDVSDMRHKEYKCLTRNIDLTKAMPKTCRKRQER